MNTDQTLRRYQQDRIPKYELNQNRAESRKNGSNVRSSFDSGQWQSWFDSMSAQPIYDMNSESKLHSLVSEFLADLKEMGVLDDYANLHPVKYALLLDSVQSGLKSDTASVIPKS